MDMARGYDAHLGVRVYKQRPCTRPKPYPVSGFTCPQLEDRETCMLPLTSQ